MPEAHKPLEARLFFESEGSLPESPVWDPVAHELVWVDIIEGLLHRTSADGSQDVTAKVGPPLPSLQLRRGGGFVASLESSVVLLDAQGTVERELARVEHTHPGTRFNEGKCDPFGNFVVGAMDRTPDHPDAGLYRITPSGDVTRMRGGLGTTNGIEFDDDGSTIWVTDTRLRTIFRGSYGPDGVLGELTPWATGRRHDGLVRDSRGEFWGAVFGAGEVVHLDADGTVLETISVPAPQTSGITIGGADLTTVFVATARENAAPEMIAEWPLSGSIFAIDIDRPGVPARAFFG